MAKRRIAQYINLLITEHFFGEGALEKELVRYIKALSEIDVSSQKPLVNIPLSHPAQFQLVRSKGALVLHCLRQVCGLPRIKELLRELADRYQGKVIDTSDVESCCRSMELIEDVQSFFDTHLRGIGKYSWNESQKVVDYSL